METLTQSETASASTEPELYLLPEKFTAEDWRRWRTASIVSVAFHFVLIVVLMLIPDTPVRPRPEPFRIVRNFTPLYVPTEFTQKAPNKGKVVRELTAEPVAPHPALKSPAPAPRSKQMPPPPQMANVPARPVFIEPPKIEADNPQPAQIARLDAPPPLPAAPAPKLTLEEVAPPPPRAPVQGRPTGAVAIPNPSIQEAIRSLSRNGVQPGQTVGDTDDTGPTGNDPTLPPSAGRPRSNLQLKSDPMGVDFKPYLMQVLQAVRRNWFAVYPEAARLGQRGQVVLGFVIGKQGTVVKVVFSTESGAKALDQAAVAAISASNPLPPLPGEFKGDRINLQMTFLYNMPR